MNLYQRLNARWTLGRKIGEGGFGKVFKITDPNGNVSALKVCPVFDPKKMPLILSEIIAVIELSANTEINNIVNTFEGWTETYDRDTHEQFGVWYRWKRPATPKEFLFLRVELCDMDLRKWLRKRPKVKERWNVLLQIARGLEFIHGKGMTHRDLKPDNILIKFVKGKTYAKVCDFGLTKAVKPGQKITGSAGTRGYMAPEQARGKPHDNTVDMWAFGVIIEDVFTWAGGDRTVWKSLAARAKKVNPRKRISATEMVKCLEDHIYDSGTDFSPKPLRGFWNRQPARRKNANRNVRWGTRKVGRRGRQYRL